MDKHRCHIIEANRGILIICAVYFLMSILFFCFYRQYTMYNLNPNSDTIDYVNIASNMLKIGLFSQDGVNPDYIRTPGYPLFLALIFMLGGNIEIAGIVQIALSVFCVFLIYKTLLLLKIRVSAALAGTAVFLFDIGSYRYASSILTETLFKFSLICSLYFLVRYFVSEGRFRYFLAFAVFINYALLVRPILLYFNIFLAVAVIVLFIIKKARLTIVAAYILCFTVVFAGWSYRNYRHSSVFIYSTIQNNNQMYYDSNLLAQRIEHLSEEDAFAYHESMFDLEYPDAKKSGLNEAQLSFLRSKYGLRYLRNHFTQYLRQYATGLFKLMVSPHRDIVMRFFSNSLFAVYLVCLLYMMLLTALWVLYLGGLALNYKKIDMPQLFILLLCAYLTVSGASGGYSRFRDPVFPLILVGAVCNGGILIERVSKIGGFSNMLGLFLKKS
ncbi:hypothetical protein R80B4_01169 [Fibrobacteres bacterium R8-0-B4]